MRLFAVSDLHVDYEANAAWIEALSRQDYRDDVLIVAGDLSHQQARLLGALSALAERFHAVLFVPGNHDLWVHSRETVSSLERHDQLAKAVEQLGVHTTPFSHRDVTIVPLLSWYDFSFGEPGPKLRKAWMDFRRCRWPQDWDSASISDHFLSLNPHPDNVPTNVDERAFVTFSHFMPRADLLPDPAVMHSGYLLPILGSWALDRQLRSYDRHTTGHHHHVYGHSHVNVDRTINGVRYVNNARGYPTEYRYHERHLHQISLPD